MKLSKWILIVVGLLTLTLMSQAAAAVDWRLQEITETSTSTASETQTSTETVTATDTETATFTATATNTPRPTRTLAPTNTPGPPTKTYTATNTKTPYLSPTPLPPSFPPSNLVAEALSNTQIRLTWQDNSWTETGFLIHHSGSYCLPNGGCFGYSIHIIAELSPNTTSFLHDVPPCGTYYYWIQAQGIPDLVDFSDEVAVETGGCVTTTPTPTSTETPTDIPTDTPTEFLTDTPAPSPSFTMTPEATYTESATSTSTFTETVVITASTTATETPVEAFTPISTDQPTDMATIATNTPFETAVQPTSTATPTKTLTPIPTVTASPVVPTLTPATLELLNNGGFETPGATDKQAADWKAKNPINARRICNQSDKIVAHSGNCAYQFKAETTRILQKPSVLPEQGDTLTLSGWIRAKKLISGGKIQVRIRYANAPTTKAEITNPIGTYVYVPVNANLMATGTVSDIRVQIQGGTGKFFIDDLSLLWTP